MQFTIGFVFRWPVLGMRLASCGGLLRNMQITLRLSMMGSVYFGRLCCAVFGISRRVLSARLFEAAMIDQGVDRTGSNVRVAAAPDAILARGSICDLKFVASADGIASGTLEGK